MRKEVFFLKPTPVLILTSLFFFYHQEQSGSDRQQWVWSSLPKQETTLLFRECSRRHIFTHRAWCPVWTLQQDCIYTEDPRRHLRLSRGRSYPEFCCRVELKPSCPRICPRTCPRSLPRYRDPHHSGERLRILSQDKVSRALQLDNSRTRNGGRAEEYALCAFLENNPRDKLACKVCIKF